MMVNHQKSHWWWWWWGHWWRPFRSSLCRTFPQSPDTCGKPSPPPCAAPSPLAPKHTFFLQGYFDITSVCILDYLHTTNLKTDKHIMLDNQSQWWWSLAVASSSWAPPLWTYWQEVPPCPKEEGLPHVLDHPPLHPNDGQLNDHHLTICCYELHCWCFSIGGVVDFRSLMCGFYVKHWNLLY